MENSKAKRWIMRNQRRMHTEIEDEMKRRVLQKASHIKLEQAFKEKANMLKKDKEDNAFKIKHKQRLEEISKMRKK